jgi:putative membrane protein
VIPQVPYCGAVPLPGELLTRFNLDPPLVFALCMLCACHLIALRKSRSGEAGHYRLYAFVGWLVASAALLSPLCALSVALFSARIAQHMVLVLVAAPLIAVGLPRTHVSTRSWPLWATCAMFFLALWFWHMPIPYDATFTSVSLYWTMHITLFGSGILLWRELLYHSPRQTAQVLAAGTLTFVQMGLLGVVLTFAQRPLFQWHVLTTAAWGLTPLQDQQLGGTLMWVPGIVLFLWTAIRSIDRMWKSMERGRPA